MFHCIGLQKDDFPVSELAATQVLDLPLYPELTLDQQESNVRGIREFFCGWFFPPLRCGKKNVGPDPPGPKIMQEAIAAAFEESIRVKREFLRENLPALVLVIEALVAMFQRGNKLLIFGNGGSAADAQHVAAEFTNRFLIERPPLAALALTTDTSALTSIANDYDYSRIFAKQLQALGKEGDIALAISTSGNSANILAALDACKDLRITTIGLTGGSGGKMAGKVDFLLSASAGKTSARIQETHILIGHVICEMVDQQLFAS